MHHIRRAVTVVGALAATALVLSACSSSGGDDSGGEGGSQTLRYMSYWTEGEPTSDILKAAATEFEKETGVEVEIQWQGRDLPEVLAPLLSSSSPKVDLVDFGCSAIAGRLQSTGKAADLASVLKEEIPGDGVTVEEVLAKDVVATGQLDGSTFCIPFELGSNFDLWFNSANHPGLADAPVETWDDFIALLDEAGPGSLALDGTIAPYAQAWFLNLAVSAAGKGGLYEAAADKTGEAFKAPEFLKAAKAVQQLVDGGYFAEGYTASKFPAMQQKWANNESQFILIGSWVPTEVAPYAAPGFEYASMPFPAIEEGATRPMQIDTIGFAAIEGAANVENAKKFIAFFLQKKYQDQIGQIAVPARTDVESVDFLKYVQEAMANDSVTSIPANDGTTAALPGWNEDVFDPLTQKLALGEISAEEFISTLVSSSKSFWDLQG